MEKVQFQLEATLPELKDLYEKGLFTKTEINQITRRRTALETALVRRVTRKEDFFRYAEYEINLERLRRVRWKRLKYDLNPPPPSASSYSLPRRTLYILKRATIKFPSDLAVWLAYIEYASRERMHKVVTKGLNSALQHHPLSSTLYLLSTYHHLHPTSPFPRSSIPSASTLTLPTSTEADEDDDDAPSGFSLEGTTPARTTLLLGLRLLPRSHELWREYIKLELGWVEALRRRWRVLGIKLAEEVPRDSAFEGDSEALIGGEGAFGPEGEDARKAILAGQLVVEAIKPALEAIQPGTDTDDVDSEDGMAFRQGLVQMLRTYPSPLRTKCLEAIYEELGRIADRGEQQGAKARLVLVTKALYDQAYDPDRKDQGGVVLEGVELVEEYGRIAKEIRKIAKSMTGPDWGDAVGPWLVEQIKQNVENTDLVSFVNLP
ncbi:U3 small nucleolar RNA-associated protein 6-domain-containing protein [Naematelia encephala]|uniref:U3 small nucleolar RNA-associated protein 6-domain-containing protein n=1 Tax=Naematelia encephala TaxID=71784 RepID=A0A1Y2B691_9TREE|nr:U3 small nucleolar RNA-associated protein 6-domain-containing protein [Naematelia encephala]